MKTAFFAISTLSILLLLLVPAGSLAAIEGRVTNPEGKSIWRARVEVAGTGISAFTDTRGRFTLGGARFPCEIRISHPRFEDSTVELPSEPAEALAISLEPKPFLLEEVVISGCRPESASGTLHTVGPLGGIVGSMNGFDISGTTGTAYAVLSQKAIFEPVMVTINLTTGAATDLGSPGGGALRGLSVANIATPIDPSTWGQIKGQFGP